MLLGLLVGGGLLSSLLVFFFVSRILKPIQDLTRGIQRIASGDFDHIVVVKTGDEIEVLAQQFNTMASALKESYTDLEERIAECTADLEQRSQELTKANARLEEMSRLKSQFLANMSHELRTPLNSIIGFTGIILQGLTGEISDEQRKQLEMVYDSGKHLLSLINDVLDLSKITAGRMEVIPETFYLAEVIDSVIAMITPLATNKNLKLLTTNMPPPDFEIYTDKNKVKQILINLFNNAVKFTERGQIEINKLTLECHFGSNFHKN